MIKVQARPWSLKAHLVIVFIDLSVLVRLCYYNLREGHSSLLWLDGRLEKIQDSQDLCRARFMPVSHWG